MDKGFLKELVRLYYKSWVDLEYALATGCGLSDAEHDSFIQLQNRLRSLLLNSGLTDSTILRLEKQAKFMVLDEFS